MPVTTKIKTNATQEQIEEAISCYINSVRSLGEGIYEVYMDNYDNYTMLPEDANETLSCNLTYKKPEITIEILETELD